MRRAKPHAIILFTLLFCACTKAVAVESTEEPQSLPPDSTPAATAPPAQPSPTAQDFIVSVEDMDVNSPLCAPTEEDDQLLFTCAENVLTITQGENRRGADIIVTREISTNIEGFSLAASVTSHPADPSRLDKNQVGFYFQVGNGREFALLVEGQYFNFEEWVTENDKEKIIALNQTYAPQLLSAGRTNKIRLVCAHSGCDLFANDALAGRFNLRDGSGFSALGILAASAWDERFGTATIADLSVEALPANRPEVQPYVLIDDLTADHGTFSQMGLSGAFSEFEADGFHFSPVIPYGYYAAKTGPSLQNVSISATVEMDYTPGVPATQYGGVICRASNEGMYMAVLRANATYTIYRDSLRQSFAMLATKPIEGIPEGRSAHHIRLDCIDDAITLFIDGAAVESFTDTRYSIGYGRSGLYTKAGGVALSNAMVFRDLEIKEIR